MKIKLTFFFLLFTLPVLFGGSAEREKNPDSFEAEAREVLQGQVLVNAAWALEQEPVTVTAQQSQRSAGGKHDFYSEGDYWWPDPENPDGPYIRRDGYSNPANFTAHRLAMIRFSRIIGSLASAYLLSGESRYVTHAFRHLKAWFVAPETLMNPSLNYAQAITGKVTGRGIGIIDTIHLMEVAQGVRVMEGAPGADSALVDDIKNWFSDYLYWLTTHPYGTDEMNRKNNHGTCWVMQAASFARLTNNDEILNFCRNRYKTVLLPDQMSADGSFPLELERTKPYGYSLFNLDAMTMVVHILSDKTHDLWNYQTPDGKSIRKGISFLYPFVEDKESWPYTQDVMYRDKWPVAHPFLLFGAEEFYKQNWFKTWKRLDHQPDEEEVIRNLPVRNPLIWFR